MIDNTDIDNVLEEFMDVLKRVYFVPVRKTIPKRFHQWMYRVFFGITWERKIKPKKESNGK